MSVNVADEKIVRYVHANLIDVFQEARKRSVTGHELLNFGHEIEKLERYVKDNGYDLNALRNFKDLEPEYITYSGSEDAKPTFRAVRAIAVRIPLAKGPKLNTAENCVNQQRVGGLFDEYLGRDERCAKFGHLAQLPHDNTFNLGPDDIEHIITQVEKEFKGIDKISKNNIDDKMVHSEALKKRKLLKMYDDNMSIILKYVVEINCAIRKFLRDNAKYPLQFDTFFVAPQVDAKSHRYAVQFISMYQNLCVSLYIQFGFAQFGWQ